MKKKDLIKRIFNKKSTGTEKQKAIVLLSGGIDSTVVLFWAKASGLDVIALEFSYAGRPPVEAERNKEICAKAGVPLYSIDYPKAKPVTAQPTPNDNAVSLTESNGIYYILAGNFAKTMGAQYILGGQIKSDWKGQNIQQSTPDFYDRLNDILKKEHGKKAPLISMPFLYKTKEYVVKLGKKLGVPFELTWTCPNDSQKHCGTCSQCQERDRAFKSAGLDENGKATSAPVQPPKFGNK